MPKVPYSSLFAYVPKGRLSSMDGLPGEAYGLTIALKQGRGRDRLIDGLGKSLGSGYFADLFGPGVVVVPAPGHAPRHSQDQFWATLSLAEAIVEALGGEVRCYLERRDMVNKAAYAEPEDRPTFRTHLYTIECVGFPELFPPERITVVDDVITRGATLAACVYCLEQVYPNAEVRAFAAVRTLSNTIDLDCIIDPVDKGYIQLIGDSTRRDP